MKYCLLIFVFVCLSVAKSYAQYDTTLARQITEMAKADQWARHLLDSIRTHHYSPQKEEIVWDVIYAMDKKHNVHLWEIINRLQSYPDNILVGNKAAQDFWLLAQHQDYDTALQKEVLKHMKWAVDRQQAPAIPYAFLVDRVRLNTGQKQLYGTQYWKAADGKMYIPRPLEDSLNVNARRATLGMKPIEEELQQMNERYRNRLNQK
ncbi:MAG: hypothetical protein EOP56_17015 [Sphingobacteriales bacterium]|nr:MAG: hypothetical protein EOP56_17015 [Sphingobacteriales bacterium]